MSWFSNLFGVSGSSNTPVAPVSNPLVPQPFHEQAQEQLDALAVFIKQVSSEISPAVYSRLRSIDDVIRPMLKHIIDNPLTAENEYAVKALLTDYITTPINIFLKLNEAEKIDGGRSDLLLLEQYDTLEKSARELNAQIYGDTVSSLETHNIFIQNKFS